MRLERKILTLIAASASLALAAACGGGASVERTATPGRTPASTPGAGRTIVPAPIDKLALITRESQPTQYAVRILSGLPNGCAQFDAARLTDRTDTTITIEVTNTMPSDQTIACTAIYGTHEAIVELGSNFAHGVNQEYVVRVNDKELRFTPQ